ncbi:proline-rich receptor-like protein kinase PERK7 isoform X2 [Sesamum indicum]|uniref:non-specific serine/threonine protein kinase n=1 Tax=Sesamum indicum TaxID=4182 RepID=A0A6I9U6H5_SESIN|nr:proline-rich receptor-like protein kinase PERK7 isoform X2 [Sesamum indicum]
MSSTDGSLDSSSSSSESSPPPPSSTSSDSSPPPPPSSSEASPVPPASDALSDGSSSTPPSPDSSSDSSSSPAPNSPSPDSDSTPPHSKSSPGSSDHDGSSISPPASERSGSHHHGGSGSTLSPPADKALPSGRHNEPAINSDKAIIAGAVAGVLLLLIIFIVALVCCIRSKKRRRQRNNGYYGDNPRGNPSYYNNWQNNGYPDGMMKLPRPPSNAGVSSEHGWMAGPPPPPPMMSGEMMSSGFSGQHGPPMPPPHPAMAIGFNQSNFTYNDLAMATSNFSQANLLGQGGFGYVYKGVLHNGKEVAVKSLKANSGQGEREFQAEVDIISRVHHRHLVSLVGYCIAGSQRLLVYEFVSNGTLEYHLYAKGRPPMDWPSRLKIALGSAKGFAYLHEDCHPRIIHRDIKAANILLDENFEAKVADFGLAKLSSDTNTHVSTRIMGTFGYLAPEYASSGKLTEKSDVYSFGIVLLELITGRRPIDVSRDDDDDTLVDWARPILMRVVEGGSYEELVDPKLENNYDPQEMLRMVTCAAACIRQSARRRPKMSKIVRALEGDVSLDDLNEGTKPGHSAVLSTSGSSLSELNKLRKATGLSSQEFSSGEHGQTGEFVNNSSELGRPNPANRP